MGGVGRQKSTSEFWWETISALTLTWASYKREDLDWAWESGDSAVFQHSRTLPIGGLRGWHREFPGRGDVQSPVVAEAAGLEQDRR